MLNLAGKVTHDGTCLPGSIFQLSTSAYIFLNLFQDLIGDVLEW